MTDKENNRPVQNRLAEGLRSHSNQSEVNRLRNLLSSADDPNEAIRNALSRQSDALSAEWEKKLAYIGEKETQLSALETEMIRRREMMAHEFSERERSLQREVADREKALKLREEHLKRRNEELQSRLANLEEHEIDLVKQLEISVDDHKKAVGELENQKIKFTTEFQEHIESKASEFVDSAITSLEASKAKFGALGRYWSIGAILTIVLGLAISIALAKSGTKGLIQHKDMQWTLLAFFAIKGGLLLGLVFAMVSFCSKFSRNYLHESLKSAERIHAINYGKFYLTAYGAGSDPDKVKEAFAHWNISATSAFSPEIQAPNQLEDLNKNIFSIIEKLMEKIPSALKN
ncbi:hypothetical protein [Herminiimonas aquatilis]|uniref:Uncharacterized protein n=1 Tax=Herminiimonas aquatilis TaxID=345342 RepID=A0ABW2J5B7_9BURK